MSIFNPHHHLELGAQFAQSRAVPFCADLRDLWGADAGTERLYSGWKHRLREWLVKRYWKKWLTQAHLVSTVTPTWGHTLAHFLGTPVTTVRNGIEAGAFEHADQVVPNTFTLAYVGSLYAEQDLAPLAKALAALPKHYKWQFQWIGAPHACAIEQLRTQLSAYGLDKERIQGKTRTSRSEALGWMRGAQILVYPAWPNQPGVIGGKVYEYLASGTPVVITAPNRQQDVVELASSVTSAAVFTTEDGVALTEWLRSKHNDWAANPTAQRDLNTAPFERSTQVAVWAAAFFEKQKG